ncbi:MAG: hypothetical protein KAH22_01945 [Thiotrichaceae bacterium]|nr:hypothetical protein [Thiotrichaceae bacterium]
MKIWLLSFLDHFWMLLNSVAIFVILSVIVIAVFKLLRPKRAVSQDFSKPITLGQPLNIKVIAAEDQQSTFQLIMSYAFDTLYKRIARSFMLLMMIGALVISLLPESLTHYLISLNILGSHLGGLGFIAQISSVIILYLSFKYIFNKDAKLVGGGCGGCS